MKDQCKSAAISISDNIAEGFELTTTLGFYRFLRISKGSCGEIRNKIHFASSLEFISERAAKILMKELNVLACQIGELMKKVRLNIQLAKKLLKDTTHNS